jgi:hypothetical protein
MATGPSGSERLQLAEPRRIADAPPKPFLRPVRLGQRTPVGRCCDESRTGARLRKLSKSAGMALKRHASRQTPPGDAERAFEVVTGWRVR